MKSSDKNVQEKNKKKNESKWSIYLGDETFDKKLFRFYSWFFPVVLFLLSCVFIYDGALVPGIIILFLSIYNFPPVKKLTQFLPRIIRIITNIALVYLFIRAIGLSV